MKILMSLRREIPSDYADYEGVALIKGEYSGLKRSPYDVVQLQETSDYIHKICKLFYPNPVWYRINDASTSFMNNLSSTEPYEQNPHFGLRGIRRAIANSSDYIKEIKMIQDIRESLPNLNILLPFINDVTQYIIAKTIAIQHGYKGKMGIMAELPSCVLTLDKFINAGVDYVVFGMNDLTDCLDGCSRKNTETKDIIYRDPFLDALNKLLDVINWNPNVEYVLSGDLTPSMIDILQKYPFDSIAIPYNITDDAMKQRLMRLK